MKLFTSVFIVILLFSGCAKKEPTPTIIKKVIIHKDKPYKFNYTPIIGTQTPDDKVIVDMGKVARVWINSYKTKSGELIASHDIYVWTKKPDFIVGTKLPIRSNRGLLNPLRKMPFMLSKDTLNRENFSDKNIKAYVNNIYKLKNSRTATKTRVNKSSKFDNSIKQYLKEIKKDKK